MVCSRRPGGLSLAGLSALLLLADSAHQVAGRALQQAQLRPIPVQSAQELKDAVQQSYARIHLETNVTISQDDFPELSVDCFLEGDTGGDNAYACQPDAVIYSGFDVPQALWTGEPDAFLDVRFLQRSLLIGKPVTLRGMNIAQIFDDRLPYFFFFASFDQGSLAIVDSTLYSPCGGRDPRYVLETLITTLPPTATYRVDDTKGQLYIANSGRVRLVDSNNPGEVVLRNTTLQCYDHRNSPFAAREIPSAWVAGAESTVVDPSDTCQRRATIGEDYRGTVNTTREGLPCQYWNTTTPQDHTRLPSRLPEYGLGASDQNSHNYCRNPDNTPDGVWCYIANEDSSSQFKRWQYCDVPLCDEAEELPSALGTGGGETAASSGDDSLSTAGIIIVCVFSALLLLLAALLFIFRHQVFPYFGCCIPVRNQSDTEMMPPANGDSSGSQDGSPSTDDQKLTVMVQSSASKAQESGGRSVGGGDRGPRSKRAKEAPEDELRRALLEMGETQHLELLTVLGQGAFGVVYRGVWKGMRVAVKAIIFSEDKHLPGVSLRREDLSRTETGGIDVQLIYREAAIAFHLIHPHIVSTYHYEVQPLDLEDADFQRTERKGVVVRDWKLFLVQEYCDGGNLAQAVKEGFFVTADDGTPHLPHVLQVAWEMANAVQYIHSKNVIHGDLTPNNVLLKSAFGTATSKSASAAESTTQSARYRALANGFATKVTDFGLSSKMSELQTHISNRRQGTPFYVSPEVQSDGFLTKASDVYALGVLFWEVFHSRRCYTRTNAGFNIRQPDFPRCKESCPLPYAVLTVACLHPDPRARPTMDEVLEILATMLTGPPLLGPTASNLTSNGAAQHDSNGSAHMSQTNSTASTMNMLPPEGVDLDRTPSAAGGSQATTYVAPATRDVLGGEATAYASDPRWTGVVSQLNHLNNPGALALLGRMKLGDVIALPAPTIASSRGSLQGPNSAASGPVGGSPSTTTGHEAGPSALPAHQRISAMAKYSDPEDYVRLGIMESLGRERQMSVSKVGGGGHAGDGAPLLQSTLDTAAELGHPMKDGGFSSDEESDDFADALEEVMADGSFRGRRVSRRTSYASSNIHSSERHPTSVGLSRKRSMSPAPPGAGGAPVSGVSDPMSGMSNMSLLSDWDAVDAVGDFRVDENGKTHFQHQRIVPGARGPTRPDGRRSSYGRISSSEVTDDQRLGMGVRAVHSGQSDGTTRTLDKLLSEDMSRNGGAGLSIDRKAVSARGLRPSDVGPRRTTLNGNMSGAAQGPHSADGYRGPTKDPSGVPALRAMSSMGDQPLTSSSLDGGGGRRPRWTTTGVTSGDYPRSGSAQSLRLSQDGDGQRGVIGARPGNRVGVVTSGELDAHNGVRRSASGGKLAGSASASTTGDLNNAAAAATRLTHSSDMHRPHQPSFTSMNARGVSMDMVPERLQQRRSNLPGEFRPMSVRRVTSDKLFPAAASTRPAAERPSASQATSTTTGGAATRMSEMRSFMALSAASKNARSGAATRPAAARVASTGMKSLFDSVRSDEESDHSSSAMSYTAKETKSEEKPAQSKPKKSGEGAKLRIADLVREGWKLVDKGSGDVSESDSVPSAYEPPSRKGAEVDGPAPSVANSIAKKVLSQATANATKQRGTKLSSKEAQQLEVDLAAYGFAPDSSMLKNPNSSKSVSSDESPLSMRGLDVSCTGSQAAEPTTGHNVSAQAVSTQGVSTIESGTSTATSVNRSGSTKSINGKTSSQSPGQPSPSSTEGRLTSDIDLVPPAQRKRLEARRSGAVGPQRGRAFGADDLAASTARRLGDGNVGSFRTPGRPGPSAAGRSSNNGSTGGGQVRMCVHPLLRNNKAALEHVKSINSTFADERRADAPENTKLVKSDPETVHKTARRVNGSDSSERVASNYSEPNK